MKIAISNNCKIVTELQNMFIVREEQRYMKHSLNRSRFLFRIRKSFIAKSVCTHKEFVLVLGASSTESLSLDFDENLNEQQ